MLFSCGVNSTDNYTRVYSTQDGEFFISIDTLNINLKPFVPSNIKVNMTHAIKYGEKYYCYFTDEKDSYNKYFFAFSNNGIINNEIKLPRALTNCFYLDLFVLHDTIFSKPYMKDKCFYLDLQRLTWIETSEPDDVIYEDTRFYITHLDFGEWGSTTWFKDQLSGKEYELASSGSIINRIDESYYICEGVTVLKIENPLKLKPCEKDNYYQIIKKKEFPIGTNSLHESVAIYHDTSYSQRDFQEPKLRINTSFKVDNKLFYLCSDSTNTFIAKLENKKMISILSFEKKYSKFEWYYSYRCKMRNNGFQLLKFDTKTNNTYGFIEIEENKINIRYLKLKNDK